MRNILIALILGASISLFAQDTEYFLNKTIAVGCYNANPLTDMSKKVIVNIKDNMAAFSIASLACKKEFNGTYLGNLGQDNTKAYYDSKEERGIVLEGSDKISLFEKKDGKYTVLRVAHTDKKAAKELSIDKEQAKYQSTFDNFDNTLKEAKEAASEAKKIASILPAPDGDYSDKYGISGLYYISEVSEILDYAKDKEYVNSVKLELILDERMVKVHFKNGRFDKLFIPKVIANALKEEVVMDLLQTEADNMNKVSVFKNAGLHFLEKDIYMVNTYSFFNSRLDCTEPKFNSGKDKGGNPLNKYVIIGKNKARVEELAKDLDKVIELGSLTTIKICNFNNLSRAAKSPMPAEGIKEAKLKADVDAVIKAKTAKLGWPQTVKYSYIKSTEWATLRHKTTKVITGRTIRAIAVLDTKNGNCQWTEISLYQDYDGTKYGSTYYGIEVGQVTPVDCTESLKYK